MYKTAKEMTKTKKAVWSDVYLVETGLDQRLVAVSTTTRKVDVWALLSPHRGFLSFCTIA